MIDDINMEEFEEVIKRNKYVVVDCWASWCGPCTVMSSIVDRLDAELGSKIKFVKLNIEEYRSLAQAYGVQSIPTLLIFKNSEYRDRIIGVRDEHVISMFLKEMIE